MRENISPETSEQERVLNPSAKWIWAVDKFKDLRGSISGINKSMELLSDINPRKMQWRELANKILGIGDEIIYKCESEDGPEPEILKKIEEVEGEIEKFVN